jgi:hypothetical protein
MTIRSIAWDPAAILLITATSILLVTVTAGVWAQSGASGTKPDAATEMVIISNPPEQGSRLHGLLAKLLGKPSGECLGATQSEVWPVRDFIKQRVQYRLNQLGLKVTQLRENWNHILSRHGLPDTMSPVQEDMLANARKSPEVVGVAVMVAPEPAIAEYALTRRTDAPASGQGVPEGASTQIIIPINDTQHVTVRRIKAVTGEQGSTWRGQVEETGDSAILMWW